MDWDVEFKRLNTLGIWHAIQHLKSVSTVKDPWELAHDVVQQAWETMWRKRDEVSFSKSLFVVTVHALASNAARDQRPVEIGYKQSNGTSRRKRITGTFPVQIFATMLNEINVPDCGDE